MTDSTEQETRPIPASVALPRIAAMISDLENRARSADDPMAALGIMESMLSADTEQELFAAQEAGTVASKDFLLIPFRLQYADIVWYRSQQRFTDQGGFPIYALLRVTRIDNGESVVVNAGGMSTVAILAKLSEFELNKPAAEKPFAPYEADGGRPLQFVGRTTQSGYEVVLLQPVTVAGENGGKTRSRASRA